MPGAWLGTAGFQPWKVGLPLPSLHFYRVHGPAFWDLPFVNDPFLTQNDQNTKKLSKISYFCKNRGLQAPAAFPGQLAENKVPQRPVDGSTRRLGITWGGLGGPAGPPGKKTEMVQK